MLADPAGKIQAAVIEFGGFLGIGVRRVILPWSELRFNHGMSPAGTVVASRNELRGPPNIRGVNTGRRANSPPMAKHQAQFGLTVFKEEL